MTQPEKTKARNMKFSSDEDDKPLAIKKPTPNSNL